MNPISDPLNQKFWEVDFSPTLQIKKLKLERSDSIKATRGRNWLTSILRNIHLPPMEHLLWS